MSSRSTRTFTQSSSRPISSEQTGLNRLAVPAVRLVPSEAALDRVADRDRLGDGERDRGVDDDPSCGRLLDGHEAGRRGRELDLDVRGELAEPDALLRHPVGVAVVGGVRLERQAALASVLAREHRGEDGRRR